jgi:hypothetical protein
MDGVILPKWLLAQVREDMKPPPDPPRTIEEAATRIRDWFTIAALDIDEYPDRHRIEVALGAPHPLGERSPAEISRYGHRTTLVARVV